LFLSKLTLSKADTVGNKYIFKESKQYPTNDNCLWWNCFYL